MRQVPLGANGSAASYTDKARGLLLVAALSLLAACSLGSPASTPTPAATPTASQAQASPSAAAPTGSPTRLLTAGASTATGPIGVTATSTSFQPVPGTTSVSVTPTGPDTGPAVGDGTATVVATGTPAINVEGYIPFDSQVYPYSIRYPPGWNARGNAGTFGGDVRGDFFLPEEPGDTEVSINVLSEVLPAGAPGDSGSYLDATSDEIERVSGGRPVNAGQAPVEGEAVPLVNWTDRSRPARTMDITQAIWVHDGRGWVVTLAAPGGQRDRYLPALRAMLETFRHR